MVRVINGFLYRSSIDVHCTYVKSRTRLKYTWSPFCLKLSSHYFFMNTKNCIIKIRINELLKLKRTCFQHDTTEMFLLKKIVVPII